MDSAQPGDQETAFQQAEMAIAAHPGLRAYLRWQAVSRIFEAAYRANRTELLALLQAASSDVDLAMELVQNVRETGIAERFANEVVQRLHNYVAASLTLVDHTRRLLQDYASSPFAEEYERRKDEVADSEVTAFVHGLRNFMLHGSLPVLRSRLSFTNANSSDQHMESETELDARTLLDWDGWKGAARQLIEDAGEGLPLRPLIEEHGRLIDSLTTWTLGQFRSLHGNEVDEVKKLIEIRNVILSGQPQPDASGPGDDLAKLTSLLN